MNKVDQGLKEIYESIIKYVLEFLKTGVFRNKTTNAYMIAYGNVHRLADDEHDSSKRLFDYYKKVINDYLKDALKEIRSLEGEDLIAAFLRENNQSKILIHWMRKVFTYLDKFYTRNSNLGTLCYNAMKIYYEVMFLPLKSRLFEAVNQAIKSDRDCNVVQRYQIKHLLKVFEEVDMKNPDLIKDQELSWIGDQSHEVLREWFEKSFKGCTTNYINAKAKKDISSLSAPEYIQSALRYLDDEDQRKNEYIHLHFHKTIDEINYKFLINENSQTISKMETGIRYMFINKKDNELKDAYNLISKLPSSLKAITEELDPYIRERGDEIYRNQAIVKDPVKFVPELIKLKKELDSLVEFAFDNHILFQDTKNKAFSFFMNKEHYSKQLSNFCDYEMKVGIKGANEIQIEDKLSDIVNLFKCLNNKLIFQIEYAKKLSDRLIANKSLSLNAEKNLISKLKAEAGVAYVNKMTSMMQDLETSKAEMGMYRSQSHRGVPFGITFNVQVLQHGAWEINESKFEKFTIPKFLSQCMEDFTNFYIGRHKTHKLTWAYGLGNLEMQYLYTKKPYQSITTLIQYSLLCILENYGSMTVEKISEMLGISKSALVNEANALLYHISFNPRKLKANGIISSDVEKDGKDLEGRNTISINQNFAGQNLKINTVPVMYKRSVKEIDDENAKNAATVRTYRNILIDANITRIMKGRIGQKTTHAFLVTEVAKQIEIFQAQPTQIKERIEALIEKQIIKRNETDRNCYDYVA